MPATGLVALVLYIQSVLYSAPVRRQNTYQRVGDILLYKETPDGHNMTSGARQMVPKV
jgi:hypothetical protein